MKKHLMFVALAILSLCGCSTKNKLDDKNIVIGCSPTPHAEILEFTKPYFEAEGYTLEIKVLNDYVTPNTLLDSEDLDANYFQHRPYLNNFNESNGTDLVSIMAVHFEPMGIYSTKHPDLLKENPTIAIPNDVSNGERARELLNEAGMTGSIVEVEAQALPSVLSDVDYAVINGNYALSAGITDRCLATEDTRSSIAERNANVIAVKSSSVEARYDWISVIVKIFNSIHVKNFINDHFGSSVRAVY